MRKTKITCDACGGTIPEGKEISDAGYVLVPIHDPQFDSDAKPPAAPVSIKLTISKPNTAGEDVCLSCARIAITKHLRIEEKTPF